MILNRFHWLNDILLPLALATMRAAWLFALVRALLALMGGLSAPDPLSFAALIWLPLAATLCARIAIRDSLDMRRARQLVGGGAVVAVALALWSQHYTAYALWNPGWLGTLVHDVVIHDNRISNSVTYGLILGALLWWRGLVAGQSRISYDAVYTSFGIGIGAWAVTLLIAQNAAPRLFNAWGSLVLLFFFVGLGALALTGLESARRGILRQAQDETGISVGFNRYWLLTVLLVIGGVLGVGLIVSALIAPDTLRDFLALFDPLFGLLGQLAYFLLYAVTFLIFLVLQPLIDFLQRLPRNPQPNPVQPQDNPVDAIMKGLQDQSQGLPPDAQLMIKVVILIVLVALAALFMGRALRRYRFADEEALDESREYIGSWAMFRAQLLAWWRALLGRWFGRRQALATAEYLPLSAEGITEGQLSIREVYQQLLSAMRGRGQPRPPGVTPHEYLITLRESLPTANDALTGITDAYGEARYGPVPAPAERVSRVNLWWTQIKKTLSGGA